MGVSLHFSYVLESCDPKERPVIIIGQLKHLQQISYNLIKCKLEPRVTREIYENSLNSLQPSPTDSCSLYLNQAKIAALPLKCSRHNTPSRSHSITKLVKSLSTAQHETILIVCEKNDVFASASAVARAYPLYSKKTVLQTTLDEFGSTLSTVAVNSLLQKDINVYVEFLVISSNGSHFLPPYFTQQKVDSNDVDDVNMIQNGDYSSGENDNNGDVLGLNDQDIELLNSVSNAIRLTAKIVDTPCNEMNVDHFIQEIINVANELRIVPTIIRGEELKEKGFGGIYGVGKGANCPPALVVLSHIVPGAQTNIAWVGKGIVYDTGGLSIKSRTSMVGMKRDCGGAAAILGAFYTAVKGGNFSKNLHAVFCLAENAVGPNSTRPDDIHTLYSGRTVEINNSDAEGRLVLADGVVYAQRDLGCNVIVDVATLTGAQAVATGKYHAAVLSNNEDWEDAAVRAGLKSGDLVFPIPFSPELHFPEYSSALADMKNSVADRSNAQPSCAGIFMLAHLGFNYPGVWIHIDMATPVHYGERATGYGVALLVTLFGHLTSYKLLKTISPYADQLLFQTENVSKKQRTN